MKEVKYNMKMLHIRPVESTTHFVAHTQCSPEKVNSIFAFIDFPGRFILIVIPQGVQYKSRIRIVH